MPIEDLDRLLEANAPPPQQPGFAPVAPTGIYRLLSERKALEPGFRELGYEVLQIGHGLILYSGRDRPSEPDSLNDYELFSDFTTAKIAAGEFAKRLSPGEPGIVTVGRIVSYSIDA